MADQKVSNLPALNGADVDSADLLYIVDSSAGTAGSKKITIGQYQLAPVSGGTANGVTYLNGSKVLTSGSALTFDGTNLGLGVTPSAWGSNYKAIQNSAGAFTNYSTSTVQLVQNGYDSGIGAWKYSATAAATRYDQAAGEHRFFNAPSGTAGNAITFTQAMTLDASGNLDLGTTGGSDRYQNIIATSARLTFNAGTGFTGSAATSIYNQSAIAMVFGTNNTERARITSAGDFIHQLNGTAPTLSTNSTMSFELTSNTSLKIVVRGTDGVTRSATLALA